MGYPHDSGYARRASTARGAWHLDHDGREGLLGGRARVPARTGPSAVDNYEFGKASRRGYPRYLIIGFICTVAFAALVAVLIWQLTLPEPKAEILYKQFPSLPPSSPTSPPPHSPSPHPPGAAPCSPPPTPSPEAPPPP
ncbi:MAG: hypothetical protein ACKVI4_17890, partial [Actinomycetales bacterium]